MHFNFDPALQDDVGPGAALPGDPVDGRLREPGQADGLRDLRPHRPQRHPGGGDPRNLAKVGYTPFNAAQLLHQVVGRPTRSRRTSPAPQRSARPSSTRPAPASTSRRTSATTSCSTSVTSGPTCRVGTPTRRSSCPTRRTTCRARTSTAPRPDRGLLAAHPVHDAARRLERRHRGRRGHPQHRHREDRRSAPTTTRPPRRHRRQESTRPTSARWPDSPGG